MANDIFLISAETKDAHCLDPLLPALRSRYDRTSSFDFFEDIGSNSGACLKEFAISDFPVAILASTSMIGFLSMVRPRESFLCIGVEHGIAPFKRYTYDQDLLSSDFYLAPTRGWAERLKSLHPELAGKVKIGGFPKIEVVRESIRRRQSSLRKAISLFQPERRSSARGGKILVVLSWGVNEDALRSFPDLDFIDYLLHPADVNLRGRLSFENAGFHVSDPSITYQLIADASLIIGDFSSLSLECIHLGKDVVFMIDRSLYATSCDMKPTFFDKDSEECGLIPHSESRIDVSQCITVAEFCALVKSHGRDIEGYKKNSPSAQFDPSFLPPADEDNRRMCVEVISKLVTYDPRVHSADAAAKGRAARAVDRMCFVSAAYQTILGRRVDHSGFRHYMGRIFDAKQSGLETAIGVWRELASSPEARRRLTPEMEDLPHLCFG